MRKIKKDMLTIQKQELGMCKKVGNTCKQLPLTAGYRFFKKLHGSIEDKFPCRYFWGRVKNKN